MNYYSRRRREILRGFRGYASPENFENLGLLECIFCILEQELKYLNRTGNKSPLKLLRIQAIFFCFS